MRTHRIQIVSRRLVIASVVLVIAVAIWGTQVAESGQGRRRPTRHTDLVDYRTAKFTLPELTGMSLSQVIKVSLESFKNAIDQ